MAHMTPIGHTWIWPIPTPNPDISVPNVAHLSIGGHTPHMGQGRPDLRRGAPVLRAEAPPAKVGPEWRRVGSASARGGVGRLLGAAGPGQLAERGEAG